MNLDGVGLTLESLQKIRDQVFPPLYYGSNKYIEKGKIVRVAESDFFPEYIAFHPDDSELIKSIVAPRELIDLQDCRIEPTSTYYENGVKRLIELLKK